MSTDYLYRCRDCNVTADEGVGSSFTEILKEFYEVYPLVLQIEQTAWIEVHVMGHYDCYRSDYHEFLGNHHGHNVCLIDEYGHKEIELK